MAKLIVMVAVFAAAWWLLKRYVRSLHKSAPPTAAVAEDMVRCSHCGVHLPRSESLALDGKLFCSEEHLKSGR